MAANPFDYAAVSGANRKVALIQPYAGHTEYVAFLNATGLAPTSIAAFIFATGSFMASAAVPGVVGFNGNPTTVFHTSAGPQAATALANVIPPNMVDFAVPVANLLHLFNFCANNFQKAKKIFIELCAAEQTASMDIRNIESYSDTTGLTGNHEALRRWIAFCASVVPDLRGDAGVHAETANFKWLKYHTTAASGIGLVRKAVDSFSNTITVAEETMEALEAAEDRPWDAAAADRIPDRLKAICYIWLDARNALPKNTWYQGARAAADLSVDEVAMVRELSKRTATLNANLGAIGGAETIEAVTALVPASLQGV